MTMLQQGRRNARSYDSDLSNWMPNGERLMRAARNRPEALLVIAAGLALLMRGAGRRRDWRSMSNQNMRDQQMRARRMRADVEDAAESAVGAVAETVREGAETATRYASDVAGRISETAGEYTNVATRWADEARETLSEQSMRLTAQASALSDDLDDAVRDHPLVLAALGVAVGAALGASLPRSRIENRTIGLARDQLGEAAEGISGRLTEAAEDALDVAKRGAERRGLSGDAMREMAREAAGAFASTAMGAEERKGSSSQGSQGSGQGPGSGGRRNV